MNSQGTTCALFAIYTTLVTLGSWFHIAAFFSFFCTQLLLTTKSEQQERQEGERKRQEDRVYGKETNKEEKRCRVKQYKSPGQEAQEYCHVARNTHQQPLEVEM